MNDIVWLGTEGRKGKAEEEKVCYGEKWWA
jgi:hypothetical protein